jgi:L-idonate 5-dehydrogenase
MKEDVMTRVVCLHAAQDVRIETRDLGAPGPGQAVVAIGAGGICGSDLHYFQDGGIGLIRVREPIILGHEAAGHVVALGADVAGLALGDMVAVNPSLPCGGCAYCLDGLAMHCTDMRFSGSAMRLPHVQGLFRDRVVVEAAQCHVVSADVTMAEAACAEPLAVCLHAASLAGDMRGRRVLITGAGPIGALCCAIAADAGAAEVVVTDLQDAALEVAMRMGATRVINVARDTALADYAQGKGHFDIGFECSAAAPAVAGAIAAMRPRGVLVQVGVAGDTPIPMNLLVGREIAYQGSFRFHAEFAQAVAAISTRRIDVRPIITATLPMEQMAQALALAGDRSRAVKVQISFAG